MYQAAITVGVFDMFHEGHANLLTRMNELADEVTVFVHDCKSTYRNKGRFPVQELNHRMINIKSTKLAGKVVPVFDPDPGYAIFHQFRSESGSMVYVRGDDWPDFPGKNVVEDLGMDIKLIPYTEGISSTKIRSQL